jgi:integrase
MSSARNFVQQSLYSDSGARKYINLHERAVLITEIKRLRRPERLFAFALLWTGARISEVLSITPQSFQLDAPLVAVRTLKRRRLVVREIPLPRRFVRDLDQCFHIRQRQRDRALACSPLWTFHRVTGWRLIKSVMQKAGISGVRATPRGLRHAFGVCTLASGVPLNIVQRLLGHSSIATTTIYTEASGKEEHALISRFWRI